MLYLGHRIAWLIVKGRWPKESLDHRLGTDAGDVFDNLREATQSQNLQNRGKPSNNKSGYLGVSWSKVMSKWHARIVADRESFHLGYFDDRLEAAAAYLAAKKIHHPFQPTPREV